MPQRPPRPIRQVTQVFLDRGLAEAHKSECHPHPRQVFDRRGAGGMTTIPISVQPHEIKRARELVASIDAWLGRFVVNLKEGLTAPLS
jgi:hypothetical protein